MTSLRFTNQPAVSCCCLHMSSLLIVLALLQLTDATTLVLSHVLCVVRECMCACHRSSDPYYLLPAFFPLCLDWNVGHGHGVIALYKSVSQ